MRVIERFVLAVDRINEIAGRAAAWLTLAMVLITFTVVVLRYVFSIGFVWLQESYVWLHGIVFMVGAGYTLAHDGHVRVDIFYRSPAAAFKRVVDLFGAVVLLLPFVVMIGWLSWPYVAVGLVAVRRLARGRRAARAVPAEVGPAGLLRAAWPAGPGHGRARGPRARRSARAAGREDPAIGADAAGGARP